MSDYKPGTVAVATVRGVPDVRVVRVASVAWASAEYVKGRDLHGFDEVTDVRPLVVIDPDDAEQAAQFARGYIESHAYSTTPWEKRAEESRDRIINAVRHGFRSLAKPSKPAEPTGLGAVVEDAEGKRWVRGPEGVHPWVTDLQHSALWFGYDEVDAVRVLSEGVA